MPILTQVISCGGLHLPPGFRYGRAVDANARAPLVTADGLWKEDGVPERHHLMMAGSLDRSDLNVPQFQNDIGEMISKSVRRLWPTQIGPPS